MHATKSSQAVNKCVTKHLYRHTRRPSTYFSVF